MNCFPHCWLGNTVFNSQRFNLLAALGSFSAYLNNFCCQLRPNNGFSVVKCLPLLADHIQGVVFGRSKKKMKRINASWIVALMTNISSLWNGPTGQYPSNPVSIHEFELCCKKPVHSCSGKEQPTAFGSCEVHLGPKSFPNSGLVNILSRYRLVAHNQLVWLCHALGCVNSARALHNLFNRTVSQRSF